MEVLPILARQHHVLAVDLSGKQGHALVLGGDPIEGRDREVTKSLVSMSWGTISNPS